MILLLLFQIILFLFRHQLLWYFYGDVLICPCFSISITITTGFPIISVSTALRTSLLNSKKSLVGSYFSSTCTIVTSNWFEPFAAPLPEQDLQDLYVVYLTFFSVPLKASSKLILTSYLKSLPLLDVRLDDPPPKSPKKSSKISENDELSKLPNP